MNLRGHSHMCFLFTAVLFYPLYVWAESELYYTSYGGESVTAVHRNPEEAPAPDHWEIWLFSPNVPQLKSLRWGMCSGPTVGSVTKQLEQGKKEEVEFQRFSGIKETRFTHFYPLGPIAVYLNKPISDKRREKLEKLQ